MRSFLYRLASGRSKGLIPVIISIFLFPLSLIYGLITAFLAFIYSSKAVQLPCKAVSIGNITLGGTGKTLAVEYISRFLKSNNKKFAILSRGYKRGGSLLSDEPLMLKERLKDIPVIVDADRIRGARRAVEGYGVDTVLLDDGFQQWRIKKDLDIVLVDAGNAFGNRMLIPAGILREGLPALRRAGVIILTKVDMSCGKAGVKEQVLRINPQALLLESVHEPAGFYRLGEEGLLGPEALKGEKAALLSGIADPDSFAALVKRLGIEAAFNFSFPDHHYYSKEELEGLVLKLKSAGITKVITTEKDSVRLMEQRRYLTGLEIFILRINLRITEGEERFRDRLLRIYSL